jgi:hypothetical protein
MSALVNRTRAIAAWTKGCRPKRRIAKRSRLTPGEVKWPAGGSSLVGTSGVSGIQTVVLKGDPTKPGLYALLLRVGPNTKIDAHAHPDDRVGTVVSGTWYFGYGREFDEKLGLPAAREALPEPPACIISR